MEIEIKVNDLNFKVFTADPETPELTIDSPEGKIYCFGGDEPHAADNLPVQAWSERSLPQDGGTRTDPRFYFCLWRTHSDGIR